MEKLDNKITDAILDYDENLTKVLGTKEDRALRGQEWLKKYLLKKEEELFEHTLKANFSMSASKILVKSLEPLVDELTKIEEQIKPIQHSKKRADKDLLKELFPKYTIARNKVDDQETHVENSERVTAAAKAQAEEALMFMKFAAENF